MTASIQLSPCLTRKLEHQICIAAQEVALHYAQNFFWSSWHSWNALNTGTPEPTRKFWDALAPFGTCLGVSTHIYFALRDALAEHADPDVQAYTEQVKLMTCAQHATSEMGYHAIVALCFDTHAIVIDHSLHSTAFKVPLGGEFAMQSYIPLFGEPGQERFKYFRNEAGAFKLTMDSVVPTYPALSFTEMDVDASVTQLAIPAARTLKPLKSHLDIMLPPRKYLAVRSLLDVEPARISSVPVNGKFLATTLRVQIDFGEPALLMQVPRADWLTEDQGMAWIGRITAMPGFRLHCLASAHLKVGLSAKFAAKMGRVEREELEFMASLGEEFGLDRKVVFDLAESVFRVWGPYRDGVGSLVMDMPQCP
jgi:hypothetical protein